MKYLSIPLLCLSSVFIGPNLFSQNFTLETSLGLGTLESGYGTSVDISGKTVAIGAPDESTYNPYNNSVGSVSIRKFVNGSWTSVQKILSPHSLENFKFGKTLAIDERRLLVGTGQSKVYSFENSGEAWELIQEIERPEEDSLITNFGRKIDILNKTTVISSDGSIYIYSLDSLGSWELIQKETKVDSDFGAAIALHNNFLAVSSTGEKSIFIFTRNSQGTYDEIQKITTAEQNVGFGLGLDMSDNWLAVRSADSVEILRLDNNLWKNFQKISIESNGSDAIRINESNLVIGIDGRTSWPSIPGFVDVYELTDDISWKKAEEVHPSDGVVGYLGGADQFGSAVALSDSFLIVGAPNKYEGSSEFEDHVRGKAYAFLSTEIAIETFEVACDQYEFDSQSLTRSGIYWSNDSTQVLNLTIKESPSSSIQICNYALFAEEVEADSYQWFNCIDSIPIPKAINPYYYPEKEGSYFLSLTIDDCTSISDCISFKPEEQEAFEPELKKIQTISDSTTSSLYRSVAVDNNTLMVAIDSKFTDVYVKNNGEWEYYQRLGLSGFGGIDLDMSNAIAWDRNATIIIKNELNKWEVGPEININQFEYTADRIPSAAIRKNIALVGVIASERGRVHVFEEQTNWSETSQITHYFDTFGESWDQFGDRIAILDESVIIAAPSAGKDDVDSGDPPYGLIFSYERDTLGIGEILQTILPPETNVRRFKLYDADNDHLIAGSGNLYSYIKGCYSKWYLSQRIEGNYLRASVSGNYLAASKEDSTDVFIQNELNQWELLSTVVGSVPSLHANTLAVINESVVNIYELNDSTILETPEDVNSTNDSTILEIPEVVNSTKNIILNLWPNPADNLVNISLTEKYPSVEFYLYNAKGSLIATKVYSYSQSIEYQGTLVPGLYFVRIRISDVSEETKKILIE